MQYVCKGIHLMKIKTLIVICAIVMGLGYTNVSRASEDNSLDVVADMAVVRPACFVVTILGSAAFVIAYPIAATSHSVKSTAHTLVLRPAHATFTRPLGDFSSLTN
jgi:hypothetical protein